MTEVPIFPSWGMISCLPWILRLLKMQWAAMFVGTHGKSGIIL